MPGLYPGRDGLGSGVVGDAKYTSLHEPAPRTMYLHAFQEGRGMFSHFALRTNVPPTTVGTAIVAYSMLVAGFVMLGAKLVQRIGRGIRLTPEGQLLANRAALAIENAHAFESARRAIHKQARPAPCL